MSADELLMGGSVTVAGATAEFGPSRAKLYQWMQSGRLPYCQVDGRRFIPRAALRKLMGENVVGLPQPEPAAGGTI